MLYKAILHNLKMDLTDAMIYANYALVVLFSATALGLIGYGIYQVRKISKENELRIKSGLEDSVKKTKP